jgi:magnesium-transporting ATPase (P-type)
MLLCSQHALHTEAVQFKNKRLPDLLCHMLHLCPDKVDKVEKGCLCIAGQAQARAVPVTMNEMLLRGCTLKNTGHILGLAVYTGNETRIQKNSAKTPNKIGKSALAIHLCLLNTIQRG